MSRRQWLTVDVRCQQHIALQNLHHVDGTAKAEGTAVPRDLIQAYELHMAGTARHSHRLQQGSERNAGPAGGTDWLWTPRQLTGEGTERQELLTANPRTGNGGSHLVRGKISTQLCQ
jgi:hypothetical protein